MIEFWKDIQFANKEFFWLFLLLPILIIWYISQLKRQEGSFVFSSHSRLPKVKTPFKSKLRHLIFLFRLIGLAFFILVLSRPQSQSSWKDIKSEGIDIVMSLDVSYSMLAKDFKPNRLEAAKEVAKEFIDQRNNDRIGLVIFGGEAFTQCPLTTDHNIIKNMFSELEAGMLAEGTAIGLGIADAVARIKESKAKSKVVILLSDGVSNVGEIAPLTAAEIAKTFGVRVYTIGVGTLGKALMPVAVYPNGQLEYDYTDVEIDEPTMKKVAEMTGGKYFRATDNKSLKNVYQEIDKMEKSIISAKSYSNKAELFWWFALIGSAFIFLEFLVKYLIIKSLT